MALLHGRVVALSLAGLCAAGGLLRADEQAEPAAPAVEFKVVGEATQAAPASEGDAAPAAPATHVQIGTIDLAQEGENTQLNTFCLDPQGRLLVAVGGATRVVRIVDGKRQVDTVESGNQVRLYSQKGELLESWEVPFAPQSLNVGPDGTSIFVAGAGQIAKLDAQGKVVKQGPTPQISDMDAFREQIRQEIAEQQKEQFKVVEEQVARAREILDKLQEKPEAERTAIDKLRLKNAERQIELLQTRAQAGEVEVEPQIDVDQYLTYKLRVPGIAVTDQDVFVAVNAVKGYGYEVWRMDHNFESPERIVSGLSGCCGQMDIQAYNSDLYVAENSRHRVCRYDRGGNLIASWGNADRTGVSGFEGCCNPMNLRFGANGEVLTAESGCGAIKRFSSDGEFLGLLGRASLQGGCKHVAIAATEDAQRVYMLDITRTRIAVLAPSSEGATQAAEDQPAAATEAPAETEKTGTLVRRPIIKLKLVAPKTADP